MTAVQVRYWSRPVQLNFSRSGEIETKWGKLFVFVRSLIEIIGYGGNTKTLSKLCTNKWYGDATINNSAVSKNSSHFAAIL